VRKLRERRNISRKELADLLGISIAVLANWEDGRGSGLAFPVIVRAITHLGGTLEDLEQIGAATENHQALGDQLAKARATSVDDESSPREKNTSDAHANVPHERTILQRIAAIEGLLQFILSILKRVAPSEAPDIERIAARWFQSAMAADEE